MGFEELNLFRALLGKVATVVTEYLILVNELVNDFPKPLVRKLKVQWCLGIYLNVIKKSICAFERKYMY